MQVSEAIIQILEKEGIPGAGINGLYKYLEKAKIKHCLYPLPVRVEMIFTKKKNKIG